MSTNRHSDLNFYFKNLSRKPYTFTCPHCKSLVSPKNFENHCSRNHGINSKLCCVWCLGVFKWQSGKKCDHASHLLYCSRKFITLNCASSSLPVDDIDKIPTIADSISNNDAVIATNQSTRTDEPKLPIMTEMCPARDFFNHSSQYIRESLPESFALGHFWLLPVEVVLLYRNDNLNLAASYLRKYTETESTHDWFHIMVKAISFTSFLRAMDEDRKVTRTLAFSCWCDGGPYEEPRHRQHRHMIVVSTPKGHFESNVWPKVKILTREDTPCKNFPCKGEKKIKSHRHLLNTLGYMSKRNSRCEFTLKSGSKRLSKKNHFYIFTTLPVGFRKSLSTQWDGGVLQILYQEKLNNVSVNILANSSNLVHEKSKWRQKIKNFYDLERKIVLPVAKCLSPIIATTREITPHYMYLTRGCKIYFKYDPENDSLDDKAWLDKQAALGNCFYDIVGDEMWTPRPRDQIKLNELVPRVQRIRELEADNTRLKTENIYLKEECANLKTDNTRLKTQNIYLKEECANLKTDNTRLKTENIHAKEECANLKADIYSLKSKMQYSDEEEEKKKNIETRRQQHNNNDLKGRE